VTLQQAVVRLGLGALREIVVEAALAERVFRAPGHEEIMARLALHSTACAHVTRLVLRQLHREVDHGFLCGLLHDIGIAAALLASVDRPEWRRLPIDVLAPVVDAVHVDASGVVATLWKLREPIRRVVASHHEVVVDGKAALVNAALVVAEQLCWEAGAGMLPPPSDADSTSVETPEPPSEGLDVNWPEVFGEARNALEMDDRQLSSARAKAFSLVASLAGEGAGYAA
jgi:hypothetical protein